MSEWERRECYDRALRAGFKLDETCECEQPIPGFGGGDRFYVNRICCRCSRRLR